MTDSHPFFRFVWRINALLILGVAVVVGAFVAYETARQALRSRSVYRAPAGGLETPLPTAERPPTAPPQEVLHVGQFTRADGPIFHAPLYAGRPGDAYKSISSMKGGGERIRNIMIFDSRTGAVTQLFPDDKGRILDEEVVSRRRGEGLQNGTLARVYAYATEDTNGDGRLDSGDRHRIVVTKPDGSNPVVIAENVDRYGAASADRAGDTILAYFLRRGPELTYGEFDLDAFKPGRTTPVAVPRT